ncbi:MAG: JAB domain-containing protein [Pseudomonadota bacterium]
MGESVHEAIAPLDEKVFQEQRVGDCSKADLLASWLKLTVPTLDSPRDLAVQLLAWSGGAAALVRTPARVVAARWGLDPGAVDSFQLAAQLGALTALEPASLSRVTGSRSVFERFTPLARSPRESFWVLGLGARNHVLVEERIAMGTANLCALLPRDVFRPLVAAGAVQAVLVHNHPSGDPTPSAEDLTLTRRLVAAGELVGVGILDHVIVGAGTWTSLLDEGLMEGSR